MWYKGVVGVLGFVVSLSCLVPHAMSFETIEQAVDPVWEYDVNIIRVIDGDTVVVDVNLGFGIWRRGEKIRLYGINTPEIYGVEKEEGLISKQYVKDKIEGKSILIYTVQDKTDLYGRRLAVLLVEGLNLNRDIVVQGLGEEKYY